MQWASKGSMRDLCVCGGGVCLKENLQLSGMVLTTLNEQLQNAINSLLDIESPQDLSSKQFIQVARAWGHFPQLPTPSSPIWVRCPIFVLRHYSVPTSITPVIPVIALHFILFICFFFQGRTCGIWKFPGQGSNWSCSASLHHSHSNKGFKPCLQPTP